MSEIRDQIIEVANVLEEHNLDVVQYDGTDDFELFDKDGNSILKEIKDFNELHSALLGYEVGYQSAVKFYKVVKY